MYFLIISFIKINFHYNINILNETGWVQKINKIFGHHILRQEDTKWEPSAREMA